MRKTETFTSVDQSAHSLTNPDEYFGKSLIPWQKSLAIARRMSMIYTACECENLTGSSFCTIYFGIFRTLPVAPFPILIKWTLCGLCNCNLLHYHSTFTHAFNINSCRLHKNLFATQRSIHAPMVYPEILRRGMCCRLFLGRFYLRTAPVNVFERLFEFVKFKASMIFTWCITYWLSNFLFGDSGDVGFLVY